MYLYFLKNLTVSTPFSHLFKATEVDQSDFKKLTQLTILN